MVCKFITKSNSVATIGKFLPINREYLRYLVRNNQLLWIEV